MKLASGLVLALACSTALASAPPPRTLTFEERVAAQTAIERVFWRHRVWPRDNPGPKPSFGATLSDAAIRAKVDDSLRATGALAALYGRSITAAELQAEMNRIAESTHDPELLRELFDALGNDPFLVAECLARPLLAGRLIRNGYARDERFHGELRRQAAAALAGASGVNSMKRMGAVYGEVTWTLSPEGSASRSPSAGEGDVVALAEDRWNAKMRELDALFPPAGTPADDAAEQAATLPLDTISPLQETNATFFATAVLEAGVDRVKTATVYWPKRTFDAWWGEERSAFPDAWPLPAGSYALAAPREGGCVADAWSPIRSGVPEARSAHTAVWTGVEMIVWGGGVGEYLQTGARYNPATDAWTPTSLGANLPSGRIAHTAVWTGTEMIVWGGYSVASPVVTRYNTGGRYNPTTDTWTPTRADATAPTPRYLHTAVWTGSAMIVWGGTNDVSTLGTGGRYDPVTDAWLPTSTGADSPGPRRNHTAVWTGGEMIIWGWSSNAGKRYDPTTDTWRAMSTGPGVPTARWNHTAVWTGSEMIVWGGYVGGGAYSNTGGRYDPISDTWSPTSTGANVPTAGQGMTAVWAQDQMIVWGAPNGTGARYFPLTDSWRPTSSAQGAPSAREDHTAVWTGREMIVWGGRAPATLAPTETGGRYDPIKDHWVPTSLGAEVPTPRWNHTAVWTGSEMIVWGGGEDWPPLNDGGRYVPATDSWSPASLGAGVPDARREHVAVWTGSEMVVWGGDGMNPDFYDSGGRYDPAADSWRATSTLSAPFGRFGPSVVWTGTEMIVWGGYDYIHMTTLTNTGGRYDPSLDRWRPTSVGTTVPQARLRHSAVWTGSEMLVWGGTVTGTPNTVGDRYDPVTDSWRAMGNGSGVPSYRVGHSAVWTGSEMIVFGGGGNVVYNSGARYDPTTDRWSPIDAGSGAPSARSLHSALWTGAEMLVWGGSNTMTALATGGRYDPATDRWSPTSTGANAPLGHVLHTAVWTGREMLIWGGSPAPSSGGAYCGCPNGRLAYADADGDGFGDPAVWIPVCDGDVPTGYVVDASDCDDANPAVHPGAEEVCNGIDDDCNGVIDDGGDQLCNDGNCCTVDACEGSSGCHHAADATPPVFTVQPSLGTCPTLWPPTHGYADFTVADTGAAATSECGIDAIEFWSCESSQPENGTGVGDGNTTRDCVYEPGIVHLRAERDGACSPVGRVYAMRIVAIDVCGNSTVSEPFDVAVWHDRGHAPPGGTIYHANASSSSDVRPGVNGAYGTGCGDGNRNCGEIGQPHDNSDADPEMEIDQNASIGVDDLHLAKASGGNISLTWTEPAHEAPIPVTRFHVYRLDPVTLFWTLIAEVTKQTTTFQDLSLDDGKSWQYKATAVIK